MESEKKTKRIIKKACSGPMIQYKSTKMPIIEEVKRETENETFCERTFISVLDDPNNIVYDELFKSKSIKKTNKSLKCIVTGQLAKYIDPVTCVPYYNSACLKIIRLAYYQQLEAHGDKSNPFVANWIKWYTRNKEKLKNEFALKIKILKR